MLGLGVVAPLSAWAEGDSGGPITACFSYGGSLYGTFANARDAVSGEDSTITLTCDVETDEYYGISKDIVFDLNGHTYTTSKSGFKVATDSTLTIKDSSDSHTGAISATGENRDAIWLLSGSNVVVDGGSISGTRYGIIGNGSTITVNNASISGNSSAIKVQKTGGTTEISNATLNSDTGYGLINFADNSAEITDTTTNALAGFYNAGTLLLTGGSINVSTYGINILSGDATTNETIINTSGDAGVNVTNGSFTMNGGEVNSSTEGKWGILTWHDSTFTMNGGTVTADSFALSGNGTIDPQKANYGSNTTWNLNAGTLTSRSTTAVYQPQANSTTTLGDNMVLTGAQTGIEVRSGNLTVNGATITSTADEYKSAANGNGTTTSGAAIVAVQHTTKQPINILINDGTFTGPVAFSQENLQGNDAESISKVQATISGGNFIATNGDPIVISGDLTKFISGGSFSKAPDTAYIADGKTAYETSQETWVVLPTVTPAADDAAKPDERDAVAAYAAGLIADMITNDESSNTSITLTPETDAEGNVTRTGIEVLKAKLAEGCTLATAVETSNGYIAESDYETTEAYSELTDYLAANYEDTQLIGLVGAQVNLYASDGTPLGIIRQLGNEVTLSAALSTDDLSPADGTTRTFFILRGHTDENGQVTVEEITDYNLDSNSLEFKTDKFSTFAVGYTDTTATNGSSSSTTTTTSDTTTSTTSDTTDTTSSESAGVGDTGRVTAQGASAMSAGILTAGAVAVIAAVAGLAAIIKRK